MHVPAPLKARKGHSEAAHYLLDQGADVTIVADSGDSAQSVAKSPQLRKKIQGERGREREGEGDGREREREMVTIALRAPGCGQLIRHRWHASYPSE